MMFYHSDQETEDWSNVFKKTSIFTPHKPSKEIDVLWVSYSNKPNDFKEGDNNDK